MEFIELPTFTKEIEELLSDDEYKELQEALVEKPLLGQVIPGGAGLRKLRWSIAGSGKRGGLRVIYYYLVVDDQIYLFYVYKKSERRDLKKSQLKLLVDYVKEGL